jgi:hypothetical protein
LLNARVQHFIVNAQVRIQHPYRHGRRFNPFLAHLTVALYPEVSVNYVREKALAVLA